MFFEGPEKKLELAISEKGPSLRWLGRPYWESVVRRARAEILSSVATASMDAYLLSESSLFVTDRWLTMITCGKTDLVSAVLKLTDSLGLERLRYLVYERKNAHFQEYQPSNFTSDIERLRQAMPGKAFRFGDGDDHHIFLFHLDRPYKPDPGDETLEVLMHGISPEASRIYMTGAVHDLMPGFEVDEHIFQPMGYSMNGVRGSKYFTVHVTPQPIGSYVSFETNCFDCGTDAIVARLMELFQPQSCDVVLFKPQGSSRQVLCAYPLKASFAGTLSCGYEILFSHHYKAQAAPKPAFEITP